MTLIDGEYINISSSNIKLFNPIESSNYIFIDLEPYLYECRLDIFSQCNFNGNITRFNTSNMYNNINLIMGNVSSWKFYASRGYECFATFFNSITNKSYT
eukprot:82064_1